MQALTVAIVAVVLACVHARVYMSPEFKAKHPEYKWSKKARPTRDVTWDKQIGKGKVFGTLGDNEQGLFGKGGYKQDIFNDHRGKLEGQAYGSRVLGPNGGTSNLGGRLDWSNKDANAALDITKQIGGRTKVSATGSGVWNLDKNTRLSAGGAIYQEIGRGKPDIAVQGQFQHDF